MKLREWHSRIIDQDHTWMVMRVIQYRITYWGTEGDWVRDVQEAKVYQDKEKAYSNARTIGGLIIIYSR